jgi:CPA1 family monovalent cation:H+ antiporter
VVLGAVVAPPDPVAPSAVAGRLRLPARLVTILEGEGQFNDATALVLYQLSVRAVVAGGVTVTQIGVGLVVAVLGGAALGLAGGWLTRRAVRLLRDPAAETTVTLAVPFGLYLAAEDIGASGVLAVLVAGLYLRATMSRELTSAGWLLGRSVWNYVEFAVTGMLFAFLGVELITVLEQSTAIGEGRPLQTAAVVVGVLVLSRAAAMFTAAAVAGRRARRQGSATPAGWREAAVTSWAGMRGVVTVATALALPQAVNDGSPFPDRTVVVLVALLVVLATLVLQGLTLAPLIRRLHVAAQGDPRAETRRLHRRVTEAALDRIRRADDIPESIRAAVLQQYQSRLSYRGQVLDLVDGDLGDEHADELLTELLSRATEAERDAVLEARRTGEVSPDAADAVLFDVEARSLRYGS